MEVASYAEYFLHAGVNFVRPVNPGVHPVLAPGATAAQIAHQKREHEEHTREFRVFQAADNALKNLLVNAVDTPYIKDLRDRVTGFATRSTRDILQYLYCTYGLVTPRNFQQTTNRSAPHMMAQRNSKPTLMASRTVFSWRTRPDSPTPSARP